MMPSSTAPPEVWEAYRTQLKQEQSISVQKADQAVLYSIGLLTLIVLYISFTSLHRRFILSC